MNNSILLIESQAICIILALVLLKFSLNSTNKCIIGMGWLTVFASVADIFRVAFEGNLVLTHIFSILNFVSFGVTGYLWFDYCCSQYAINNKLLKTVAVLPALTVAVLGLMSVNSGCVYSVDNGCVQCGPLFYTAFINYVYVFMSFAAAVFAAKNAKNRRKGRGYIMLSCCAAPVLLSAVISIIFPDGFVTVTYAILISLIMVCSNLQHRKMVTDNLTKLQNRYGMDDEIEEQLSQYRKNKNDSFYVIVCDMDNFKTINDTWGHLEGDRALKLIADALTKVAKQHNSHVFRIGGDEFVIITDTSENGLAEDVCRSIENELDNIDFRDDFDLHMSMGVALYNGTCAVSELISGADKKLYQAKRKNKGIN